MATTPFPWTEPLRLRFTALDPTQTHIFDAGAPEPPIIFAPSSQRSSRTWSDTLGSSHEPGNSHWNGPLGALRLSVTGDITPEEPVPIGPPSAESSPSPSRTAPETSSASQPLYVVHTESGRARWLRRRRTYVSLGSGQPVATIFWPAMRPFSKPSVEMARRGGGHVKLESMRTWVRERWRGLRDREDNR
jgi:hypothetical protein